MKRYISDLFPFRRMSLSASFFLMKKMATCVHKIHKCGIFHMDLKLENFIYDHENDSVFVADFETAT